MKKTYVIKALNVESFTTDEGVRDRDKLESWPSLRRFRASKSTQEATAGPLTSRWPWRS
jgi:hypothetical protein